jgi:GT2 family glycosyltransferase
VSVVIPAFNVSASIGAQLEALAGQSYPGVFEVVVADNNSTDDLAAAVAPFHDRLDVRVVRAGHAQGVSAARNAGCRAARGELIAVCDGDDVVDPGWLAALVTALGDADVVGGRLDTTLLNPPEVRRWRAVAAERTLPVALGYLGYAVGANTGLRRTVFDAVGGWDESLRAGGDDVDFSWRAQQAGFRLAHAPDAVVHYRLRPDLRSAARQVRSYGRAQATLAVRHRAAGARPKTPAQVLGEVGWLVSRLPYALMPWSWRRGRWFLRLASLRGRLAESVRARTWAL